MTKTCKITKILNNENGLNPVLVNFQNGTFDSSESNITAGLYEDHKKKQIAALAINNRLYTGDVIQNNDYNTFLAVKRKNSDKMVLIAVNNSLLSVSLPKRTRLTDTVKSPVVTKSELNKQFGSKKAKRTTEQYERMKMNTENVAQVLEKTVAGMEVNEGDLVQPDVSGDSTYKPPINREASKVEDIYKLNQLVPLDELTAAKEDIDSVLETDEKTIKENLCPIISDEIMKIINGKSNKEKLPILIYIDCLIKMLLSQAKHISSKKFNPCPNFFKLGIYILNNFTLTTKASRTRPTSMRDKTICYILVLTAIACDYKLNLEILGKELKISAKKLLEIARALSFTAMRNNKDIELKLPLPSPFVNFVSKRRK